MIAGSLGGQSQVWEKLPNLPEPNGGLVCAAIDGRVILLGGTNWEAGPAKNWLSGVYEFNPVTEQWHALARMKQPLAYGIGGCIGDSVVVVGGSSGTAPFRGVVRVAGRSVAEQPTGGVPLGAVLSAGGAVGEEIIFAGGSGDAADIKGFGREAHAWNSRTQALRSLAPYPGVGFGTAASVVLNGELYVFAGVAWDFKADALANITDAFVYAPRTNAWRRIKPYPQATRGVAAVALNDHEIYLAGGFGRDGFVAEGFVYDVRTNEYRAAPPLPYPLGTHLVRCGDYVYALGGEDRPKHRSVEAFRSRVAALLERGK